MKKILFYTFLSIFAITAAITLLGILKVIIIDSFYLKGLFGSLIIELIGSVIAIYKSADFFPKEKLETNTDTNLSTNISSEYQKNCDYKIIDINGEIFISPLTNFSNGSKVSVSFGDLTNQKYTGTKCIALPVNSSFKDECIKRKTSSTGAYIHAYLGDNASASYDAIYALFSKATNAIGQLVVAKNFLGKEDNVFFIAVTSQGQDGLIRTNPISISYASQELVRHARIHEIFEITCPIFGSGNGGVPPIIALTAMIKGVLEAFQVFGCNKITVRIIAHHTSFKSIEEIVKGLKNGINAA
jgi:hypothetical protein